MEKTYRIIPKHFLRNVENEGVLLVPDTDALFALSESAMLIWQEMLNNGGTITKSKMMMRLKENYEVDDATLTIDIDGFIQTMIKENLVEEIES